MEINIQENIPLSNYTNFKVGGPAKYFINCKNISQILEAINWAKENNQKIFVLADGTNMITSSRGFEGLVVKISLDSLNINGTIVEASAGTSMKKLVDESIANGLAGLEWAGGLPGSFGGAIRGNAGAFGGEIKDNIEEVTSISLETGKEIIRSNNDCSFEYRGSYFKHHPVEIIVLAKLKLEKGNKEKLREIADSRIAFRKEKHPMEYPNSGSIFKNTPLEKVPKKYLEVWKDVIKTDPFPVVPTAKILADANLAGERVGGAELSKKHTNYIVNTDNATGEDILELIKRIKKIIKNKYDIELEVEPDLLGF